MYGIAMGLKVNIFVSDITFFKTHNKLTDVVQESPVHLQQGFVKITNHLYTLVTFYLLQGEGWEIHGLLHFILVKKKKSDTDARTPLKTNMTNCGSYRAFIVA